MKAAIGSRVKIEGKFDYENSRRTYLTGTVVKAERTLCSRYDPEGDTLYTLELDNGRTTKVTSGLILPE